MQQGSAPHCEPFPNPQCLRCDLGLQDGARTGFSRAAASVRVSCVPRAHWLPLGEIPTAKPSAVPMPRGGRGSGLDFRPPFRGFLESDFMYAQPSSTVH